MPDLDASDVLSVGNFETALELLACLCAEVRCLLAVAEVERDRPDRVVDATGDGLQHVVAQLQLFTGLDKSVQVGGVLKQSLVCALPKQV